MSRERLVSVIVPTHNSEEFIVECMQSIMNQTYKNLEIICVDSSKDSTLAILEGLKEEDARIQIIQDDNGSYGHKINVGIRLAKGDYITIVESDDYIRPEMYEDMLEGLQDEIVDYVKCAADYFMDVKGKRCFVKNMSEIIENKVNSKIDLTKEPELAWLEIPKIWSALYRKNFLLENDIWLNETQGASFQDTSFAMLVAIHAKTCIYKSGPHYCYRNDNINSSVKSSAKVFCVCDEYEYLKNTLIKRQMYAGNVYKRILKEKLYTYSWNIKRLTKESADAFRDYIRVELDECRAELKDSLCPNDIACIDILSKQDVLEQYWTEKEAAIEKWKNFIALIKSEDEFVLVGAGDISRKVLFVQSLCKKKFICAIGDNNYTKFKDGVEGYDVEAVQTVVEKYPKGKYIIANKNNYKQIRQQLESSGISEKQIFDLNRNIGKLELYEVCKNCL